MNQRLDQDEWIRRLDEAGVDYVLVGGLGVAVYGIDYVIHDIDSRSG